MSFLSLKFLTLLLLVYPVYWNLKNRHKRFLIILASCVFYAFFSVNFLLHLLLILAINFYLLHSFGQHKHYLKWVIAINLTNLGFFKYFYFLLQTIGHLLQIEALQQSSQLNQYISQLLNISGFEIVLPMTISYYTFQFISLAVDYRKGLFKQPRWFEVASYILFFPIMIAGPILRFAQVRRQFYTPKMNQEDMLDGIWLILQGIFKKAVLASALTTNIYPIFASYEQYSATALLFTSYLIAINLFLDFSGLTDMARGIGKLFGFSLPENFKAPFFLNGFGDFWRRWHLTFSFWIRDYIYIPLGGSRCTPLRNHLNLIITFGLGGIWHGASAGFVLWGILTGIFISIERTLEQKKIRLIPKIPYIGPILKYILVIHIYFITWILFLAPGVREAMAIIMRIVTLQAGKSLLYIESSLYVMLFTLIFHFIQQWPQKFQVMGKFRQITIPVLSFIMLLALIANQGGNIDFAYGKF